MTLIRWRRATAPGFSPFHAELGGKSTKDTESEHFASLHRPAAAFSPALDITETASSFLVLVEVPGLSAADINIELAAGKLTLSGEKKATGLEEGEFALRTERRVGRFERTLHLPNSIDSEKVNASCEAGILRLEIGKRDPVLPRRIEVTEA